MRVLIVSAFDEVRRAVAAALGEAGPFVPVFAASVAEALAALPADGPAVDVLLVDAEPEACRRFRGPAHLKDLPLLLLTDLPGAEAFERARAADASDFVRKPVEAAELLGRMRAACALKRQLDDCREHTKELERLTVMDELTGIANRRFFNRLVAQEWARAVREVVPLSLILIDIDHFKDYNDHYGHQQGDACLRRVAGALTAAARRPGDHVARYGGEEFTVLLSHTGIHGALSVAEVLRARVEGLSLEHARSSVGCRVTISLGVASTVPERSGSPEALLASADQAIYAAKRDGRNRTRAGPDPFPPAATE